MSTYIIRYCNYLSTNVLSFDLIQILALAILGQTPSFGGHIDRDFDVPPFRIVVSDIDVDMNDRICVRQGLPELPLFDLISTLRKVNILQQ